MGAQSQSTRTCTTVSLAPHSHLSSSLKPLILACVASHEWPVPSCTSTYALFLCRGPYSFCVHFAGSPSSNLRRCLPLPVDCHSFCHSSSIFSLFCFFCAEKRRRNLCVSSGLTAPFARMSAASFPGIPLCPGIQRRRSFTRCVRRSFARFRMLRTMC